jgi:hypothetical protein
MPRYAYGRDTCEGCASLDIRRLRRENLLQPGRRSGWSWSRGGAPAGDIQIEIEDGAALLTYRARQYAGQEWRDIRQRVPITWTACTLGGRRPWFLCAVYANGRYCGRRVAILYAGGEKPARPQSQPGAENPNAARRQPEPVRSLPGQAAAHALAHLRAAGRSRSCRRGALPRIDEGISGQAGSEPTAAIAATVYHPHTNAATRAAYSMRAP